MTKYLPLIVFAAAVVAAVVATPSSRSETRAIVVCPVPVGTPVLAGGAPVPALHANAARARVAGPVQCVDNTQTPVYVADADGGRVLLDAGEPSGRVLSSLDCTGALVDAGLSPTPYALGCWAFSCGEGGTAATVGMADICEQPDAGPQVRSACVVPNCWADGGVWDDSAVVDCRYSFDGGPGVWRGCNVMHVSEAVGSACVPSECVLVSGAGVNEL